jgi:hypothetical protein
MERSVKGTFIILLILGLELLIGLLIGLSLPSILLLIAATSLLGAITLLLWREHVEVDDV